MSFRRLKAEILRVLHLSGFQPSMLDKLHASPARKVNPLISFLYHGDPKVRWRAVTSLGYVVSQMAATELEASRVVMRRLMWSLNDESGGIGWGAPEAMAEIMACEHRLGDEFASILVSYIDPRANFLEHAGLQCGVLWGIGRLARVRVDWMKASVPFILPFFNAADPALRGLAVWSGAPLDDEKLWASIQSLKNDGASFILFDQNHLKTYTISETVARHQARRNKVNHQNSHLRKP